MELKLCMTDSVCKLLNHFMDFKIPLANNLIQKFCLNPLERNLMTQWTSAEGTYDFRNARLVYLETRSLMAFVLGGIHKLRHTLRGA